MTVKPNEEILYIFLFYNYKLLILNYSFILIELYLLSRRTDFHSVSWLFV